MENSEAAQGMNLQVNKLSYGINIGRSKATFKTILKNVSFSINSGSLCALMGPSGSGKSTLLDLLAGRKTTGEWSGEVLFNNKPRSKWFNRDSAYVLQDDLHIPTLTVRETVYFSAWVRLPEHTSKEKLDERVDNLLKIMQLDHIRDSMVGGTVSIRGISGGEMKRLSIAVEIVSLPTCIFLDEPTSSLDSEMAFGVISTVRGLCNGQKTTCIATIHQPAQRVFDLFDTVILIAQGHLIYFGPASTAVDYFCKHNFDAYQLTELKLDENPAEVLLEISESLVPSLLKLPGTEMNESNDGPTFLTADYMEQCYCQSELKKTMDNLFYDSLDSVKNTSSRLDDTMYQRLYATGSFTQFQMLLYRSFLAIIRDKAQLIALSVKSLVAGLATAAIFYNRGKTELPIYTSSGLPDAGVNSVSAIMFFAIFYTMVTNLEAVPFLCSRYAIYQREIAAFAYDVGPYWLAQSIVMVPILFLSTFIFINVSYFLLDFPREWEYYIYFQLVLQLANLSAYYFVMFLSAATNNAKIALQLFPIYFIFNSVFTGYTIHVNNFPPMWSWATWIVPFRWGFQGAMFNHWKKYDNDVPEDKKTVLGLFGYPADWNKYYSLLILLGITGIMLFLTYLAMLPAQNKLQYVDEDKLVTIQQESNTIVDTQSKQGNDVDIEMASIGLESCSSPNIGIESPVGSIVSPQRQFSTQSNQFTLEQQQSLQKRHSSRRLGREDLPQKFHRVKTGKTLSFKNIHYLIEQTGNKKNQGGDDGKKEKLHILKGISGIARAGQLMALMGPSGAGKSTLLDILADRKTTGLLKGDIFVNNQPRTAELMKKQSAYVMQDDSHHLPNLTVRETLIFASWLRLPHNSSDATTLSAVVDDDEEENGHVLTTENASQRVDEILEMLNLTEVANNLVGGVHSGHRGISGGQRKRLSIGVEIIHLPKIIFLDEPTTGLDSSMAFDVIRVLRSLAAANRTIICTIHQPSASCFDLFDTLLLLTKGRCAYYGNASTAQPYFMNSHYGFKYSNMKLLDDNVSRRPSDAVLETIQLEEPESRSNPADFFMSVASGMVPDRQGEMVSPEDLAKLYEGSDEAAQLRASIFAQQFHYSVNNNQVVYDFNDGHQTTTVQQTDVEGVSREVNYQALESNVLSAEPYRSIHHYNQHYDRQVFQNSISISQHHKQLPGSGNNSETSEQTNSEVTSVHSFSMTAAFLKSSTVVNPLHWQVRVLLYRLWMNKIRNYRLLILNSVKYMIAASFFGSILYRNATLSGDSYEAYTQRLSTFFYISTFILVGHEKDIPNFIEDRPLLYREVSSNAYTRFAYWLSRNMIELPFMMIDVLIYSLITYKMTSLRGGLNSEYFGYYLAIMYLHDICCFMLWQIIAGISASAQVSMSFIPLTKFFLMSFQGFVVFIPEFEKFLIWGPYIDFMRYVTQALMLNELQDNPDLPLSRDFIEQLGFDTFTKNDALYILIGFTIGLSIISSLVMNYINYEKR